MAFLTKIPMKSKILLDDLTMKQISYLKYLGNHESFEYDKDVQIKVLCFQGMCVVQLKEQKAIQL